MLAIVSNANLLKSYRARSAVGAFVLLLCSCTAWTLAGATPASTVRGRVLDSGGRPLPRATVRLQDENKRQTRAVSSDSTGSYIFTELSADTYTLHAEMPSLGEAAVGPFSLTAGESKQVDLRIPASSTHSEQPAFFDEPQFTVAGVTDTTNLGGHGSNATSRTKAELTRDIATLAGSTGGRDTGLNPSGDANEKALRTRADANPNDFVANHQVGKLLAANGKDIDALPYLDRAAKLRPKDFENGHALVLAYERTGRLTQARDTAQALLQQHEQDSGQNKAVILHLLGDIEEKLGNPLEAVRRYQRATELNPSESNLFDWGAELLLHHAPEPAGDVFTRGHRLFPHSARMLTGLGVSWYVRGSYDKATEWLGEACDLAPDDPVPHMFLGRLLSSDTGRSGIYLEKLRRFAERQRDNAWANYYYALSLLKQRTGPEDAKSLPLIESLLEKAIRLDPKLAAGYLQLGAIYSERPDLSKAISAYQKAAEADPTLEEAYYRLAQAYRRTGDVTKAQAELQRYNQLSKEAAAKEEKERREIQQFVYSVQGRSSSPPPNN